MGGITQSMLGRFLVCRERFRVAYIEGLQTDEGFSQRLEYGQMWHACEEAFALSGNPIVINRVADTPWERALITYCKGLAEKYPMQREQIAHWYNVCKTQFPIYVKYWKKHPDVLKRTPLLQEQVFDVPYVLPSGRVVRLRGKWDSVDLVKEKRGSVIWLQENKSKGDIDEVSMQRQLTFDLQTMIYLIALETQFPKGTKSLPPGAWNNPIKGVRYNVIRRPLSGGKGSIRKHQPTKSNPSGESDEEFYARLGGIIGEDPSYFFMRWHVEITPSDIEKFKTQCLNPVLEQLCDWYEQVTGQSCGDVRNSYRTTPLNFRFPYGVYNPMTEGRASDVDEYLATGSTAGLRRVDSLFSELAE